MIRPVIGYTTRNGFLAPLHALTATAIYLAGGIPVRLSPAKPHYQARLDGLIINGGTDLYPAHYKGDPKPDYIYDEARDAMEIKWLERAEEYNLPVLGICRGAQLMNVSRGGNLHVDVEKVYEKATYPAGLLANIFFRKTIAIKFYSILYGIIKADKIPVNSMHKQAINELGENLQIAATEENGVIQAIEDRSKPYYIGVQFHPEALIYKKRFRNIFKHLVKTAKERL